MIFTTEDELYRTLTTKTLLRYPFDTANVGFKMLIEAVVITIKNNEPFANMRKIFAKIAQERNIKIASVDKSIKKAIDTAKSAIGFNDINYHSALMKQAFIYGKPKCMVLTTRDIVKAEVDNYLRNLQVD